MITDWLTAIGTIAVAIIAVFQDQIRSWFSRPKFDVSINVAPPDSHKTSMALQRNGEIIQTADCYYFRIRVCNTGNRRAEYVEIYASELQKQQADGSFARVETFLPMNLLWSHIRRPFQPAISPKMEKLCDLGHIIDPAARLDFDMDNNPVLDVPVDQTVFGFDVEVQSFAKGYIIEPGKYRLKLLIGASNSEPVSKTFEITITGKWFADERKMLSSGIGIKPIE